MKGKIAATAILGLLACVGEVQAQSYSCSGGGFDRKITLPASISVPRDAPVGTVLTPWFLSVADSNVFTCLMQGGPDGSRVDYLGTGTPTGITIPPPAMTTGSTVAHVVPTNVPGIGLALGARVWSRNTARGWQAGRVWPRITLFNDDNGNNGTLRKGGQAAFALVKIAGPVSAGTVQESAPILELTPVATPGGSWSPVTYSLAGTVRIVPLTCSTPDINVAMGAVPTNDFNGMGSTSKSTSYSIQLNACPVGVSAITYQLDPVTAIIDPNNSVIALTPGGATGVGLKLMDNAGQPVRLGSPIAVSGYTPGGNVSIPLKAAYYQTGAAPPVPGDANAVVHFTMTYE